MSKNIKIELELPDFEKELIITVNLRRDGEEITSSSTTTKDSVVVKDEQPAWKQEAEVINEPIKSPEKPKRRSSGNLMNLTDF